MIKILVTIATLLPALLPGSEVAKRIQAHCTIQDYATACSEGRAAVAKNPHDKTLWRAHITALAETGYEKEMMEAYRRSGLEDRQILETMAWGVLNRGAKSPSPMTRIYAMVAGSYTQDIRGVNILHHHLNDRSALLRWVAVQLSSNLRDSKLQKGIMQLLQKERHPMVRQQAVETMGKMRCKESRGQLLALLQSAQATAEEKAAAIQSLAMMFEQISREELNRLVHSDRAALRALACQVITTLEQKQDADLLVPLIHDTHSEVRTAALTALGSLNVETGKADDPHDHVAIHAAWAQTRRGAPEGLAAFERLLAHSDRKVRIRAAAALASCGKFGLPLMHQKLHHDDPIVGMNLALGLIGQREKTEEAARILGEGLNQVHERLMLEENVAFRALVPSDVAHHPLIPQYPEAVNQAARLEILNILAILHYPNTQEVMKKFLQQRAWGISGMASALLLTEGDESALAIVEELLEDPNPKIKIQAALVLSLWGKSPKAIATLEKSYEHADRDLKEKIIEGVGRVGETASLPFLVDRLEEPHQTLRVLGAMALLQCLYH